MIELWLLDNWNVAENIGMEFLLNIINLDLNSHMWLVATLLYDTVVDAEI